MIHKKIEEYIGLTEAILTEHLCQGVCQDTLKKHIHKDCLWIGAIASEYTRGKEEILYTLQKEAGKLPTFVLTSKQFECVGHDRKMVIISGRYIGHTVGNADEIFRNMQRVTFVWKEEDGFPWLMHFHVSNPITNVEKEEGFPHVLGTFTKEYMDALLLENENKLLTVKDENNAYQKISIAEIMYIESFDKNCVIHLKGTDMLVRASLSEIEERIAEIGSQIIVRVQKSFAVNKFFVNSIKRYEVEVAKKFIVPISRSRYEEIQKLLLFTSGDEK